MCSIHLYNGQILLLIAYWELGSKQHMHAYIINVKFLRRYMVKCSQFSHVFLLYSTKYHTLTPSITNQQIIQSIDYYLEYERTSLESDIRNAQFIISQSINRKARTTQIMPPYSLTSAVNHSSSCQDIPNHNPGTASAALKQGNSQALRSRLNYD